MRIVYVLTSLGMGGAERQALALAATMAARGHTVAILVLRPPVAEQWPTFLQVIHLGMRRNLLSFLASMARGRHFLGQFRPDLVHSHSFHANFVARLFKLLNPSLIVLSSVHNIYEGGRSRMFAYRLTDPLASRVTAVGQAVMDRFVRLKAVSSRKCIVVANGADTSEFSPSATRRQSTRADLGADSKFIWLAAGRLVPAKDYPNLLRAFQRVFLLRPDARLWIAGEDPGGASAALQAMATELGLDASVRWLGLRRDLPALLDAADGFVLASAWEGMPLAAAEAMAMQKLLVATDVGSVRELVGSTGLLVPPKAPEALASAMLELMRLDPEHAQALGASARDRVIAHFSLDARADDWEALYEACIDAA